LQLFKFYLRFKKWPRWCCIVKTDIVNCGTAYCTGDPHHLPRWPPADDTQWPPPPTSPNKWPTPDYAAITNRSQPTSPPQPTPAASVQQSTDSKDDDHRVTIVSLYAGYFDVAVGREAPRWVGGPRRASRPRLLLMSASKLNAKYLGKIAHVIVTQC